MIYFMQSTDGGPVKIGFSDDVDRRRAQLEAHYGQPLAILATMDGGQDEEREIHRRFAHLRFGRTEQFQPASDLMDFIGRPLLVGINPNTIEAMVPVTVRLDAELVNKAKHVVLIRGVSLAEYLSELLRGPIDRDFVKEMRKLAKEGEGSEK